MRLTLRTMLAYLDGILEPADAQDIGKKIEESEYATGLVHRIRDVMRRLRLGAPSPTDRSSQLDPNAVAEYLDNILASEAVTDFEKVCLDSDVHLAEVAACHQILTLVLGEPAEIDAAARQRMYQLKDMPASAGPPPTPAVGQSPAAVSAGGPPALNLEGDGDSGQRKARPRPTVPEYLREPRKKGRWLPAVTVVLVACFTLFVLMALGQFEPGTPLGNTLVRWGLRQAPQPPREVAAAPQEERPVKKGEGGETKMTPGKEPETKPPGEPAKKLPLQPGAELPKEPVNEPAKELGKEALAPPVKEPAREPVGEMLQEPAKTPAKQPTADVVIKEASPEGPQPPPAVRNLPKPPEAAGPGKDQPTEIGRKPAPDAESPAGSDKKGAPERIAEDKPQLTATERSVLPRKPGTSAEKTAEKPEIKPALPPMPEPLGRFMSSDQVLLVDDPKGGWLRVAPSQMLLPQRLLALPTYRARIGLAMGVTLEVLGGTQIELLAGGPQELPGIHVRYGRVVMIPVGQPGSRLRVVFGDRRGVLTFSDAESIAALDVRHVHVPGTNPEAGPPHIVANLYASTGSIVWDEPGGDEAAKKVQLTAPQWVSFNAALTSEPAVSKELPKWITAEPLSAWDRRASVALAQPQALPTDRLARLALMEVVTLRPQKEVRWLALRCLGYIGQFNDLVKTLNDPARKLDWPEYVDQLREAVARDAQSAAAVRVALETQYPQQAADLYRMLWGYSDKDLQTGADKDLVKALEDDTLAVRVLSFWNLRELTGLGLFYRPEQTAAKRLQPTVRWRQRLEAGEIRLKTPEEKAGAAATENTARPSGAEADK